MAKHFLSLAAIGCAVVMVILGGCTTVQPQSRQEHIHHMGHGVMPFDLSKTMHIFQMTEEGGIERVVAKDPNDAEQITLIQQHLQHEAEHFKNGDYSDPAMLHGEDMPGLAELRAGAQRVTVNYAPIPTGAAITFKTQDVHLLTAIHQWFGAQLSEHGQDATYR